MWSLTSGVQCTYIERSARVPDWSDCFSALRAIKSRASQGLRATQRQTGEAGFANNKSCGLFCQTLSDKRLCWKLFEGMREMFYPGNLKAEPISYIRVSVIESLGTALHAHWTTAQSGLATTGNTQHQRQTIMILNSYSCKSPILHCYTQMTQIDHLQDWTIVINVTVSSVESKNTWLIKFLNVTCTCPFPYCAFTVFLFCLFTVLSTHIKLH